MMMVLCLPALSDGKTLDLDADEEPAQVNAAPAADFTIPVKVNGKEVECGFWKGQDPADVAIEFGTLHSLDGKKIARLRQALQEEAQEQGLIVADDQKPTPYVRPKDKYNTAMAAKEGGGERRTVRTSEGLSIATLNDRFAQMQVATIKFAHSPFCQKFCTKENAGILGLAMSICGANLIWALVRYKKRKDTIKQKMEKLEEKHEEERERQKALFENCVSSSEAEALRGAFKNQIKSIQQREARAKAGMGPTEIKWGWPDWGYKRNMKD